MDTVMTPNTNLLALISMSTTKKDCKGVKQKSDSFPLRAFLSEDLKGYRKNQQASYDIYSPCPRCGHNDDFVVYEHLALCKSQSRPDETSENIDIYEYLMRVKGYDFEIAQEYISLANEHFKATKTFPQLPILKTSEERFLQRLCDEFGEEATEQEMRASFHENEDSFLEKVKKEPLKIALRKILNKSMPLSYKNKLIMELMNTEHAFIVIGSKSFVLCDDKESISCLSRQVFEDVYM